MKPLSCVPMLFVTACLAPSTRVAPVPSANASQGVRGVAFESAEFETSCGDLGTVRLREGTRATAEWTFRVDHVVFGDLTGDGSEEAVVVATCTTEGSAGPIPEYHVFGVADGRLRRMGAIEGGSKMLDADSARIENGALVITRWFQDGNATPLQEQTEWLSWDGRSFSRVKITAKANADVE